GAIATFMAWNRIEHARGPIAVVQQQPQMQLTKIVVARTNLYFGNRLSAEQLREVDWPEGSIPEGAFKSIGEVTNTDKPRTVLRTIEANEPVLASKISYAGFCLKQTAVIDGTMRARTIRVNDVIAVAAFLVPINPAH